jgi:hypothetical protein
MKMGAKLGVILVTLTVCAGAFAAPQPDPVRSADAIPNKAKPPSTDLIFNRKLASTSISLSSDVLPISSGLVAIDSPLTFNCPKGGCTLTADVHVQMGENTKAGNLLGVCAELDGSIMPPGCPNIATIPTDETFVGGSFAFAQSGVTAGTHTIQGFVDTTDGATRAYYNITYRLYTP